MREVIERQLQQRRAVSEATKRLSVHVVSSRYRTGHTPLHQVLIDDEYYAADSGDLRLLRGGSTPDELGLERVSEDWGNE
jgi:hypothetical protein